MNLQAAIKQATRPDTFPPLDRATALSTDDATCQDTEETTYLYTDQSTLQVIDRATERATYEPMVSSISESLTPDFPWD